MAEVQLSGISTGIDTKAIVDQLMAVEGQRLQNYQLALTDVSFIHLVNTPIFETVIPSKIFEAMATRTPIILGVKGEAKEIIEEYLLSVLGYGVDN